jgi:hypothetical protein
LVLIGYTAVFLAKEWEKLAIASFKYSQFGALAFEKDVRAVSAHVVAAAGGAYSSGVRDRFIRLSQICTLINLDGVGEVKEVWGTGSSIKWRLTVGEVKRVLGMRVDFGAEEIKRLKL